MTQLSSFQQKFSGALKGADGDFSPLLSVYRNTVLKGSIDALVANYPTVERIVGAEWLRAVARQFVAQEPPRVPSLLAYGAAFSDWLANFPPAQSIDYLADVARLDRLWTESHLARDAVALTIADFAALGAVRLECTAALLHPSARFMAFDRNIVSLWKANRSADSSVSDFELGDCPEYALVIRPHLEVHCQLLTRAAFDFLQACRRRESLAAAAAIAARSAPAADLSHVIAECFETGIVCGMQTVAEETPQWSN